MRWIRLASLALAIGFGIGLLTFTASFAQVKTPPDFTFDQGKDSPGKVTFSHEKHKEKNPKCTDCHTKVFKMKKGTTGALTMAAMDQGKLCGSCHEGKAAFATNDKANCTKCHVKG